MLEVLIPIIGLVIALGVLIRGADIFAGGASALGGGLGMKRPTARVLVGLGAVLPQIAVAIAASRMGNADIVLAYGIGLQIALLCFVHAATVLFGGTRTREHDLSKSELPFFAFGMVLTIFSLFDGVIDRLESVLLLSIGLVYLAHLFLRAHEEGKLRSEAKPAIRIHTIGFMVGGLIALGFGAKISIDMIERLGGVFMLPVSFLALIVLAFGTAFPHMVHAVRGVREADRMIVPDSFLGTSTIGLLFMIGIPGFSQTLITDKATLALGLPFMIVLSLVVGILGLTARSMRWEGVALLMLYAFFIVKLVIFLL